MLALGYWDTEIKNILDGVPALMEVLPLYMQGDRTEVRTKARRTVYAMVRRFRFVLNSMGEMLRMVSKEAVRMIDVLERFFWQHYEG